MKEEQPTLRNSTNERSRWLPVVERQVGSMALSEVSGAGATAMMRAVSWYNVLARLGMAVPLVVVHDIGCIVAGISGPSSTSRGLGEPRLGELWRSFLAEVADTDLARLPGAWKHRDAMIGAVLARVLGGVVGHLPEETRMQRPSELPVEVVHYLRVDPRSAYTRYEQDFAQD